MFWKTALTAATAAFFGSAAGVALTLLAADRMSLQRHDEALVLQAVSNLIEAAWSPNNRAGTRDHARLTSMLAVYASPELFKDYSTYVSQGCADPHLSEQENCKIIWAEVVQTMRKEFNNEWLNKKDIIAGLWGSEP